MRRWVWLLASLLLWGMGCKKSASPEKKPLEQKQTSQQNQRLLKKMLSSLPQRSRRKMDEKEVLRLARLALTCVDREYPNKPGLVLESDRSLLPPRKQHPAFFGCFDWHSAVHSHWTLVRLLKKFPQISVAREIREILSNHLSASNLERETATFQQKHQAGFERPYGWAWFLRLAAELHPWKKDDALPWRDALKPLEKLLVQRTIDYLSRLSVPIRAGTHASTAFALSHIFDYARITGNAELRQAIVDAGRRFYLDDRNCPARYEPSGEDFISPCLAEAEVMRRILPQAEFLRWLDAFLPAVTSEQFATLRQPPKVLDRKDPRIGHLIGLSFHRAWSFQGLASSLPPNDPRRAFFEGLALLHQEDGLKQIFDSGYGGAHWLASFAVYTLTEVGLQRR